VSEPLSYSGLLVKSVRLEGGCVLLEMSYCSPRNMRKSRE
jgi:hypothetical protein